MRQANQIPSNGCTEVARCHRQGICITDSEERGDYKITRLQFAYDMLFLVMCVAQRAPDAGLGLQKRYGESGGKHGQSSGGGVIKIYIYGHFRPGDRHFQLRTKSGCLFDRGRVGDIRPPDLLGLQQTSARQLSLEGVRTTLMRCVVKGC